MTGPEIAEWRNKNKLSQSEIAKALGVTRQTVGRWERGRIQPPDDIRGKLTKILTDKGKSYVRVAGYPAAKVLPQMPGYHVKEEKKSWQKEQNAARKKNDAIRQAAELAAGARVEQLKKELEREKAMSEKIDIPEKVKFQDLKSMMFAMYTLRDEADSISNVEGCAVHEILDLAECELSRRLEAGVTR